MAFAVAKTASKAFAGRKATRARTSSKVVCAAADRTLWLPSVTPPAHLNGTLPGDFGFDPLGLGQDAERLKWFAEGEKTNGRWAMMAVVGILGTELLGVEPKWFEAGAKEYDIPAGPLTAIEFLVVGFLETKRWQGFKETGSSGFVNSFPFDPAGMNSPDMAVKEIKNGRLAMIAFIGFAVQALVTRAGPIEGLTAHLSNPFENNFISSLNNLPAVIGQ